uniref:Uncharacterized protein n=1 Tax=Romanomermis culicivorax TaxID=13658 RepID=A0A915HKW3_ROMCU
MEGLTSDYLVIKDPSSNVVDNDNVGKTGQIMQIKYCSAISRSSPVLVICTTIGLIIYDWKSLAILLHIPCPKDDNGEFGFFDFILI